MSTILPAPMMQPLHTQHADRLDDQTWDEYESTRYFLARMRGEQPELRDAHLGADLSGFGTGGMG